jgi:hypothetical protein
MRAESFGIVVKIARLPGSCWVALPAARHDRPAPYRRIYLANFLVLERIIGITRKILRNQKIFRKIEWRLRDARQGVAAVAEGALVLV